MNLQYLHCVVTVFVGACIRSGTLSAELRAHWPYASVRLKIYHRKRSKMFISSCLVLMFASDVSSARNFIFL